MHSIKYNDNNNNNNNDDDDDDDDDANANDNDNDNDNAQSNDNDNDNDDNNDNDNNDNDNISDREFQTYVSATSLRKARHSHFPVSTLLCTRHRMPLSRVLLAALGSRMEFLPKIPQTACKHRLSMNMPVL